MLLVAGCTWQQQLLLSLLPDDTFTVLLSNLQGVEETNRRRLEGFERAGDWDGLLRFAEENIRHDPRTAEWRFVQGTAHGRKGDWTAAAAAFAEAQRLDPLDLENWHMRAQAERLAGNPARAVQTLERALAIKRNSAVTFYLLGEAHAAAGSRERAEAALREALRLAPDFLEARRALELISATPPRARHDALGA